MPEIPGIPPEAERLFAELHDDELAPTTTLREELADYAALVMSTKPENELLDNQLVGNLARACEALIELAEAEGADEATRRVVQAAVRYFVAVDDSEPDRDSLWGLDDDASVCNAVARHLGRDDLVVEVS